MGLPHAFSARSCSLHVHANTPINAHLHGVHRTRLRARSLFCGIKE